MAEYMDWWLKFSEQSEENACNEVAEQLKNSNFPNKVRKMHVMKLPNNCAITPRHLGQP